MIYLTFNDLPSGVYESQVINKCIRKNKNSKTIKIIAFIPLRNFIANKKKNSPIQKLNKHNCHSTVSIYKALETQPFHFSNILIFLQF